MKKYIEIYNTDIEKIKELKKINHNNISYVLENEFISTYSGVFMDNYEDVPVSAASRCTAIEAEYSGIDVNREENLRKAVIFDFLYRLIARRKILVVLDKDEKFLEVK